jgi:ribose 5-phosphate isomerase B
MDKKIFIASDHAGFLAKQDIKDILVELDFKFEDLGPYSEGSVDYPIYAKKVANKVQENLNSSFGILICGSGTGMAIAANKFEGIRANLAYDEYSAKFSRLDNDANVLTLRAIEFDHSKYKNIVETFLLTEFSGEFRHQRRIDEVTKMRQED